MSTRDESIEPTWTGDLLVGRQVGEYRVLQRIGSGGMGVVYEAEQPLIGRRVAIKVLRGDVVPGRGLLDEARAANQVRHRGIVDIHGFGELEGVGQYLVMELLEGKPLDAVLREEGALRPADAVYILDEILAPLEAAHARGVIHRDLKPSNVFLVNEPGGERYVKLLDFGLARKMSVPGDRKRQTRVTGIVGTPHYLAPEQVRNNVAGPRTDLWAVGVIAYELLTGRMPFDGKDPFEVMTQVVNGTPRTVTSWVNVPVDLNDLVMELLAKTPETRPHSAQVVRGHLKRIRRELSDAQTQLFKDAPRTPTYQEMPAAQVTPVLPQVPPPVTPAPASSAQSANAANTPVSSLPPPEEPLPPDTLDLSSQPDLQSHVRTDVSVVVPEEVLARRRAQADAGGGGAPRGSRSKVIVVGAVVALAAGATALAWTSLQAPAPEPLPVQPLPLSARGAPPSAALPPPPQPPQLAAVVPASAVVPAAPMLLDVDAGGSEDAGLDADAVAVAGPGSPDAGETADSGETADAGASADEGVGNLLEDLTLVPLLDAGSPDGPPSAATTSASEDVEDGGAAESETPKVRKKRPARKIIIHRAGSGL